MIKLITAVEDDGFEVKRVHILLKSDFKLDLHKAIREACKEYCQTEEGSMVYKGNGCNFNWECFAMYVPEEICKRHGFEKIGTYMFKEQVALNEQLVVKSDVLPKE